MSARLLVVADSLAFYGPVRGELLTHPGLFPNVAARELSRTASRPKRPVGDPRSVDPGSVDPRSVDPGSVDPGSVDPGSVDPGSVDPAPVGWPTQTADAADADQPGPAAAGGTRVGDRARPGVVPRADEPTLVEADVVARLGWTARDAWEALTRDPRVYSLLLPAADAVVLAVGGMDYLPAILPTHLREGIRYLRPPLLRRGVRALYRSAQPVGARLTGGRWRTLPQRLTDDYLSRCVSGIRYYHPGMPIIGTVPPPHRAALYGRVTAGHAGAVAAAERWGEREGVPMVDLPAVIGQHLSAGGGNPDGLHWGWAAHAAVGRAVADAVRSHPDWPRRGG